jgi:hypothetical protein
MNFPKNLYVKIDGDKPDEFFNASNDASVLAEFGEQTKIATYQLVTVQTGELIAKFSQLPAKKKR